MDTIKIALKGFWLIFVVAVLVVALSIFAPNIIPQGRFISGIPVSTVERIAYPATGVSGLPTCNSRNAGKTYIFTDSLYDSATCDGVGTWDHYFGGLPVFPLVEANFTSFNSGPETQINAGGLVQISAPALVGDNFRVRAVPYPVGDVDFIIGFTSDIVQASFHNSGITIFDDPVTTVKTFGQITNVVPVIQIFRFTSFTGAGGAAETALNTGGFQVPIWLRYTDIGGTRTFQYNRVGPLPTGNSATWHTIQSEASGTFVTPEWIGIYINVAEVACPLTTQFISCTLNGVACQ